MALMDTLMGPLFLGVALNLVLYGLSVMQTYTYFLQYRETDGRWIKYLVLFLFIADTVNSAFDTAFAYDYLIKKFGNLEQVTRTTWIFNTDQAMTGIIAATVQYFFAWRVYRLTGKRWIALAIAVMATVQGLAAIGTSIACSIIRPFFELQKIRSIVIVWLGFAVLNDIVITTSLVWYLRHHKTGFAVTDDIISKLIRLTVQTGAITSVWATVDLAVYLGVNNALHLVFNIPLSKLYTNSILSVLNARSRWEQSSAGAGVISDASEHHRSPRGNGIPMKRGSFAASRAKPNGLSGINVNVTTRTDVHTDNYEIELGGRVTHVGVGDRTPPMEKVVESDGSLYAISHELDVDAKNVSPV